MEHLRLGLSIPQIMAKHRKRFLEVCEKGEDLTWDLFICDQDIRNVAGRLARETYKRDNNDAKFVRMWVQEHPHLVFYYKESGVHVRGAITRDNMPFMIGIQTSWQQDMMLKHGHKKLSPLMPRLQLMRTRFVPYILHGLSSSSLSQLSTLLRHMLHQCSL